ESNPVGTSHRFQRTSPTPLRGPGLFSGSEGIDCARGLALPAVAGPSLSVDCVELRGLWSATPSTACTSSRTLWVQAIAERRSSLPYRVGSFSGSEGIDCARGLALPAVAGPSLSVDCVELRGLWSATHSTLSTSSRTLWEQVIAFKEQARPPYGDRACSAEAKGFEPLEACTSPVFKT